MVILSSGLSVSWGPGPCLVVLIKFVCCCCCFLKQLAAATTKSLQSCLTLCNPIDSSPPGSPFPGILQARTLKWVAISFSNAWKWKVKVKSLSRVRLFATPWNAAHQAPPSIEFSRQEYWSGLPLPSLLDVLVTLYYPRGASREISGFDCVFSLALTLFPSQGTS